MNIDVVKIKDKNYYVVKEVKKQKDIYLFLINENDNTDIVIRKKIEENGEFYLVGLNSEREFNMAMKLLVEEFDK